MTSSVLVLIIIGGGCGFVFAKEGRNILLSYCYSTAAVYVLVWVIDAVEAGSCRYIMREQLSKRM